MGHWSEAWKRWHFFVQRKKLDRELDEEINAHLLMDIRENLATGMNPKEARHAAKRAFGNVAMAKEDIRAVWTLTVLQSLWWDLRYGIRVLTKSPVVAIAAVLSLALVIGANSTVFSVMNAVLLSPFPHESPDRIVRITEVRVDEPERWRNPPLESFLEWNQTAQSFEVLGLANPWEEIQTISVNSQPESGRIQFVSLSLFSLLGVEPRLGRDFVSDDLAFNTSETVIVSDQFWRRRLGGDPQILGQPLGLPSSATIIGVMPQGFWVFPWNRETDVWRAFNTSQNLLTPETRWFGMLGRLKPGVSVEQARVEIQATFEHQQAEDPATEEGWQIEVETIRDAYLDDWSESFILLFGFGALVLLIGCANTANMLLARARKREREIAVRLSLGAGRGRLIRQLLTESFVLASLAGILGLLLTNWGIQLFVILAPDYWSLRAEEIVVDGWVLLFTAGVTLLTGVLFGLVPALRASVPDLHESLKEGGRRSTVGAHPRIRNLLVVGEVTLAVILLVCASLMVNSFFRVQTVDPGYDPRDLLTSWIPLTGKRYLHQAGGDVKKVSPQVDVFYQELLERAEALPGVESAAVIGSFRCGLEIPAASLGEKEPVAGVCHAVSADYFSTMGIPVLRGRTLSKHDGEGSQWVAVINQALARRYFPGEEVIGRLLDVSFESGQVFAKEGRSREIVGIIGDIRHWGLGYEPQPAVYIPDRQHLWEYPGGSHRIHTGKSLLVRTAVNPVNLAPLVERVIGEVDPVQAPFSIDTMEEILSESIEYWRFWMRVFGFFAAVAVILVVAGIYGVMSYAVSERTHEIGVRMALGAQRADVLKLVLRQGLQLTLVGVAIGVTAALGLTRLISSFLYEVEPTDPLTFGLVSILVVAVAVAACWVPARWATRVDPLVALRCE